MMAPCKVTFFLDGTGVHWTPSEPIHLDALLVFAAAAHHAGPEAPDRDEAPKEIPIPCTRWQSGGEWGWRASALFPDGPQAESIEFWRKRFRQNRAHLSAGSPNLTNATWRDYNMPMPLLLCHRMVAWCVGDRREIRHELIRNIRSLGKKRAHGHGRVVKIEVDNCAEDWSCVRDGAATRWLPLASGFRQCRARPPYWNRIDTLPMCEIGDPYDLQNLKG